MLKLFNKQSQLIFQFKQASLLQQGRNMLFSTSQRRNNASPAKVSESPIVQSIAQMNDDLKHKHSQKKDEKFYMSKMSQQRIDKIGAKSLLDKQWAEQPLGVLKNPHKLTEVELYKTLEKIVELPEKRLKQMSKLGTNAIDEVFMVNITQRIPQFLTATLVNLTKTLLIQKDYFKDHPIWKPLEMEIYRRKNNLNNEQLADVIHAFGVTGNGHKELYYDLEETVIDSPIPIETQHLEKILIGYSQIDQGTPVLYSHIAEKIINRGLDQLEVTKISEIAKHFSRATNVHKAGFGLYHKMEKHIKNELHQGRVNFAQLCTIVENILPSNIGANAFQNDLEQFLVQMYSTENLQNNVNLIKGLTNYKIKNKELDYLMYKTIDTFVKEFTLKQLETLIWSVSKQFKANNQSNVSHDISGLIEFKEKTVQSLIERVKTKSPSMKPRGVAFAIESITNLNYKDEQVFQRFERVVLSKLDEFIPHYLVKVLNSYYQMGFGSGELYDKVINQIILGMTNEQLKYSDMLRFFEIFPEVSYIFENTMTEELYTHFVTKILSIIKDKKFPTDDVCRVFNILVRISGYQSQALMKSKEHQRFMNELIGKIRHSVYDIPKHQFAPTLSNLIEIQQPELANKFTFIIKEVIKNKNLDQEFDLQNKIKIFWSLMQLEKACCDENIININSLRFLEEVELSSLDSRHFLLYKQLVCLVKMWDQFKLLEDVENKDQAVPLNFDGIYSKFEHLSQEKREEIINEDSATKTQQRTVQELLKHLKQTKVFTDFKSNISDDIMNLINIVCGYKRGKNEEFLGLLIMNKHCYFQGVNEEEPIIKRSVEIKQEILSYFSWDLAVIDEEEFLLQDDKAKYINERLKLKEFLDEGDKQDQQQESTDEKRSAGGRKVRRPASFKQSSATSQVDE